MNDSKTNKKEKKSLTSEELKKRKEFDFDFSETEDEIETEEVIEENVEIDATEEDHYFSDKMFIRLKMALDRVKKNYSDLRNEMRKLDDKLIFRSNNTGDVYLLKGKVVLKVTVFARSLKVYFALSMRDFDKKDIEKYHIVDMSDVKKYEHIPCMLRISSDRAYRYFLEILQKFTKKHRISKKSEKVDAIDYETDLLSNSQELLHLLGYDDMLVKSCTKETAEVLPKNIAKNCQVLQTNPFKTRGKKVYGEITIGEMSQALKSKYDITLDLLKDIGLVSQDATSLRVLAKGDCKCKLSVVADDYEVEALKMIIITGGNAIKYV